MRIASWILGPFVILTVGCQGVDLSALQIPALSPRRHSAQNTDFELASCEIAPNRRATCRIVVTNRFRDKQLEVYGGVTIQDDSGVDYPVTAGGFGQVQSSPKWVQVAVADSTYDLFLVADNLSTRAQAVRAVVFRRLTVRIPRGPVSHLDKVVFAGPPMIAGGGGTGGAPAAAASPTTAASPASPSTSPAASTAASSPRARPSPAAPAGDPSRFAADGWHVVGYWNYDAVDGQSLVTYGLVLRLVPGSGLGQRWEGHLELENHALLRSRQRALFPVKINTRLRKICANYPGYPSYAAIVDMPGDSEDGVYEVQECAGG